MQKTTTYKRCAWCSDDPLYQSYHDQEWGVPVFASAALFERLVLESMQAGLSWFTILKKRQHMQQTFFEFDPQRLARADQQQLDVWLQDPGIIRHRGKLEAMVNNAKLTVATPDFSNMLWRFAQTPAAAHGATVPSSTDASVAMSKHLKKLGFRFVGPTICYAFMQSVGMVNDHAKSCWRFAACEELHQRALEAIG